MLTEFWIPLTLFALAASVTPGPNNLMLTASGMNHGFRQTLPHIAGICLGFPVMLLCVIFGIGAIIGTHALLGQLMQLLSAGFILYFAWKIATTETEFATTPVARPLTLGQAALFQWVNPKGWAVALAVAGLYAPRGIHDWEKSIAMAVLFVIIGGTCCACWTYFGTVIRRWLRHKRVRRRFNQAMAAALVLSMLPLLHSGQA